MQYEFAKQMVVEKMTQMAEAVEKTVDDEMEQMRAMAEKRQKWLSNGHGTYEEIAGEPLDKEFFKAAKKSKRTVVHFYRNSTERCKIVDMHLSQLAPKHIETRFVKINAEKCPFLV